MPRQVLLGEALAIVTPKYTAPMLLNDGLYFGAVPVEPPSTLRRRLKFSDDPFPEGAIWHSESLAHFHDGAESEFSDRLR